MSLVVEELIAKLGLEVDESAIDKMKEFFHGLTEGAHGVQVAFGALAVAVAAGIGTAIASASAVQSMANRLGAPVEALQEVQKAAEITGVSTDTLNHSLGILTRTAGQAALGNAEAQESFKKLGVNIRDSNGKVKDSVTLLEELHPAFDKLGSNAERAALAQKLFGRGAIELAPFLNKTTEQIEALKEEARAMGTIFTEEQTQEAKKVTLEIHRAEMGLTGMRNQLFGNVKVMRVVEHIFHLVGNVLESLMPTFTAIGNALGDIFEVGEAIVKAVFAPIAAILSPVVGFFKKISEHSGVWRVAMLALVGIVSALLIPALWGAASAAVAAMLPFIIAEGPFILLALIIAAIAEDIWVFANGGDSFLESITDALGITHRVRDTFLGIWDILTHITDPAMWDDLGRWLASLWGDLGTALKNVGVMILDFIKEGVKGLIEALPGGKLLLQTLGGGAGLSPEHWAQMGAQGGASSPNAAADLSAGDGPQGGKVTTTATIHIHGGNGTPEEIGQAAKKGMDDHHREVNSRAKASLKNYPGRSTP